MDTENIIETESPPELNTDAILNLDDAPKRRGRPKGSRNTPKDGDEFTINLDDPDGVKKPRRGRRSTKLSGQDVSDLIEMTSQIAVLMTDYPHWHIPAEETKPFAGNIAELMNRIPSKYVRAMTDMNGYVMIAVGMYGVLNPRIEMQRRIVAQKKRERMIHQEHDTGENNAEPATDSPTVPWRAEA